jgi:hypothetical protein
MRFHCLALKGSATTDDDGPLGDLGRRSVVSVVAHMNGKISGGLTTLQDDDL